MILTFNAKTVNCEILEKTLIGRKEVVDRLYQELREKSINEETYQSLIIAPRGSGKTHLTKVIYCRLQADSELSDKIVVAYMVEDEYGIVNFLHFCLRVLTAIDRYNAIPDSNIKARIQEISTLPVKEQETAISSYLRSLLGNKKLIILVENLDSLLKGMSDNGAALRDFMHEYNNISLIATAQSLTRQFNDEKYPFYNFFKTRHLEKLSFDESYELIKALIDVEENLELKEKLNLAISESNEVKSKIRAIYDLTCGNHRLLVHFYSFLKADLKSDLSKVFIKQMNDLKTYYEQFVGNLSIQQQRIVQLLSLNHTPLKGKEISQQSFMERNIVSKQLSELYKLGFIDKHKKGKNVFYEIREPLMRICFEINENPDGSAKLFVDFLKIIYDEVNRKKNYLKYKLSAQYVNSELQARYISEASIYEKTLNKSDIASLLDLEKDLKTCTAAELDAKIEEKLSKLKIDSNVKTKLLFTKIIGNTDIQKTNENIEQLKVIIEKEPGNKKAKLILSKCYTLQKKYPKAISILQDAINLDSKNADLHHLLGLNLKLSGQITTAIVQIKKALEINPNDYKIHSSYASALNSNNQIEEAIIHYKKALEINPNNADIHYNLAIAQEANNQISEAIIHYKKGLEINPNNADIHNDLAIALKANNQISEAIIHYKKGLEINPNNADIHNNLAIALKANSQISEAIIHYKKGLEINPNNADIHYNLAIALKANNQISEAIIHYKKGLEINPNNADIHYNLAIAQEANNQISEAIIHYKKGLEINPNNAGIRNSLSLAYLELKEWKKSNEEIQKALKLEPKNCYHLGTSIQVHLYMNDWEKTIKILDTIFKEELEYNSLMIAEDILIPLCRWSPEQLMSENFIKALACFKTENKQELFYEAFIFACFNILINIEKYSKERLDLAEQIFKTTSELSDKIVIPHLLLNIGIDYLKNNNEEAIFKLSKEERQVFDKEVLQKIKHIKQQ